MSDGEDAAAGQEEAGKEERAERRYDPTPARELILGAVYDPYAAQGRELAYSGRTYNPAELRERTRAWLAKGLVLVLAVVAALLLLLPSIHAISVNDAKDLAVAIFAPLTVLTGTVFGFYYGGHHGGE